MTEEISARSVTKFDGSNFQGWKFQVRALFMANGILEVVDGTRVRPEDHNTAAAKAWVRDNAKAMFLISSTMEYSQLESLLTCTTAEDMWVKLSQIHEQKSASNKLLLTQKFIEHRMGSNDSVVLHIAKVQNLARQLADVGENLTEVTVMAKILGSLTTKFNMFQTAWDSVDPDRQNLVSLQERLIKEEAKLNAENEADGAFYTEKKKNPKKSAAQPERKGQKHGQSKKELQCFRCKKKGHFARECRSKPKDNTNINPVVYNDSAFVLESDRRSSDKRASKKSGLSTDRAMAWLLEADTSEIWLTDSGASRHVTYRREWFTELRPTKDEGTISLGDNGLCAVQGVGTIEILKLVNGQWHTGRIENVLYVPKLRKNLFSVGVCTTRGFEVTFDEDSVEVKRGRVTVASGLKQKNSLYRMFFRVQPPVKQPEVNVTSMSLQTWHERLGHASEKTLREMVQRGLVSGVKLRDIKKFFCEACKLGKSHRLPFSSSVKKRDVKPGEYIHSDVCGPMSVASPGGAKLFLLFKDDATGYRQVHFLKHKADVFEKYREFEKLVTNTFGYPIKTLRCDNGREYCNEKFKKHLKEQGVVMENSAPYTPEQNGKVERDNRTVVECARTMLQAKNLPQYLWAEAVNTAVYILNRVVTSGTSIEKTPYELWTGKKPNLQHIKIFGSEAYAHIPKLFTTKFDARARKMLLVGYQGESSNYRLFDPSNKKIIVSRNVIFNEKSDQLHLEETENEEAEIKLSGHNDEEDRGEDDEVDDTPAPREDDYDSDDVFLEPVGEQFEQQDLEPERRNLRNRASLRPPLRYETNVAEHELPRSFQEAVTGADGTWWKKAIDDELQAHTKNNTWSLVERKQEVRTIDSKWVFKIIEEANTKKLRYKARVCARGCKQRHGIDFTETFSPVVRYDTLRVLLATVARENLKLGQFDVQTAFLYGDLDEEIYMEIPEGVNSKGIEAGATCERANLVCKLEKSLYGLKQAPRCWNKRFTGFLKQFKLNETEADKSLFKGKFEGERIYLALFVDDGLVVAESERGVQAVVDCLRSEFVITVSDTSTFVGMQIERDCKSKSIFLHQRNYTEKLIEKFNMSEAKAVSIPADPHAVLQAARDSDKILTDVPYREAVGSLIFLSIVSRPDITYAVSNVSKYLNKPNLSHWKAVKRIIAYLIGTKEFGILYTSKANSRNLQGYSDADYASDVNTRRSITGYVFSLAQGPVTWTSQQQKLVTLSTTEAEYVAAAAAAKEIVWLRKLLKELGYSCDRPTTLHVDNQSAIRLIKNPEFHKRTKHIDIRYHYVRETVANRDVKLEYIPTAIQKADIFTKALPKIRFCNLRESLGVICGAVKHSNGGSVEEVSRALI